MQDIQRLRIAALVFFLSGASALVFETVWFRVTSSVLGSSVWSAAAVLTAFMTGLGLGNAFMLLRGQRIVRVFRFYVIVELAIAVSGVAAVLVLPAIAPAASRVLANFSDQPGLLSAARFAIACAVLLIPALAMGTTLPVLLKGLHGLDRSFSAALGRLYGWNTLGAVAGVAVAEFVLIGLLGIRHTALFAAALNLCAALLVLKYFRLGTATEDRPPATPAARPGLGWLLLVPFTAGLTLLALEVVWFRFLLLAHDGTSVVFATMLALVLAGIGIGGLLATRFDLRGPRLDRAIAGLLLAGAGSVVAGFYLCNRIYLAWFFDLTQHLGVFALTAGVLMLPASIVSGLLFPLLGEKLHRSLGVTTRTSGVLTLVNTAGAALGSSLATFALLPLLGVERSLLLLCFFYLAAGLALLLSRMSALAPRPWTGALALASALVAGLFPHGAMQQAYTTYAARMLPGEKLLFVKEGLNETLQYYRLERLGQPLMHRLVTNGFSMSGTSFHSQRYMKFFVYLPHLLMPQMRDALLISYGVGNTAQAIASLARVQRYDIVDISRDVLDHSDIIQGSGDDHPLRDPRARVHVEDGRFYLQTSARRFDLITGEPPPPRNAGVVNLYTREYFALMNQRLKPGGIASYWLPGQSLSEAAALSIIKAFCLAFEDCSLWAPAGLDFVLLGSRGKLAPVSAAALAAPWRTGLADTLAAIGYEDPAQLLTNFVADAPTLLQLTRAVAPVSDDYPGRIAPEPLRDTQRFSPLYAQFLDPQRRREAFRRSPWIERLFEPETIARALDNFAYEAMYTAILTPRYMGFDFPYWAQLIEVLQQTRFEVLPAMSLGTSPLELRFAEAAANGGEEVELLRAKGLLARRDYRAATELLLRRLDMVSPSERDYMQRLALVSAGLHGAQSGAWSAFESLAAGAGTGNAFGNWLRTRLAAPGSQPAQRSSIGSGQ